MEETPPPSKISDKNSWPAREDHSISRDGSRGWPDWNAPESLKCKDSSEWPSWECSKGNKDIQKGDTIGTEVLTVADSSFDEQRYGWPSWECSKGNKDIQKGDTIGTEVLTVADSSFDEQRERGRFRESSGDRGWNGSSKRHSEMSKRNSWHVTKDHSRSHNGHSRRCPDWDAHNSSKCKDDSGWSSWQSSQVNKDTHNDDTIDREVHTVSNYTSDEQRRGQSKIRKRGRSRTRQSEYSNSWSPNPCNGLRQASCSLIEKGSVSEMTFRQCRDFAAGKCFRASQCMFLHQDAFNSSKCKDDSGWPSWEFSQEKKDTHNDDTIDRDVHTISNYTSDEQRSQSKIWKRGRSRSRRRKYSKSRSRSPCNGLRQASCRLIEKGSVSEMTSRRCSDFAAGKCFRGFQSRFLHQGYLKSRDGDHSRNDLTERSKFRADDRGTLQFGDYKGYASDYCDEVESRKNTLCWKKLLEGKSFREESCRYSHNKSAGEEYDSRNERVIYDQNVKPLINQNDIGHCKYFSIGRCHQNDCRFSHDVGRVTTDFLDAANTKEYDEDCSLDRPKAKISGRGEGEIKSEKGSAWDKFAGVSEKPKDATGWGKWPSKPDNYTGNSNSHDSQSKRWDGRSKGNICSQDLSEVMKQIDNNILRNSVKKYGERNDSGLNGKLSERDKLIDLNMPADREKAIGQGKGKDKAKSWNGPTWGKDCSLDGLNAKLSGWEENTKKSENDSTWDKFAGVSERPKDTVSQDNWPAWPDSPNWKSNSHHPQSKMRDGRSKGNIYSQEPIDAKKQADNNIFYNTVKKSSERADPGRNDEFSERKEFLQSHLGNGAANINMDLKMSVIKEKAAGQDKDMTKLWNGPTWGDEGCYLDRSKETGRDGRTIGNRDPRVFVDIEKHNDGNIAHNIVHKDTTKSWNSPTWGGEWCSLDRPKATGKGDRVISNRDPRICADVEERNDGNISYSFVEKGIQKSGSEWTKKVTVRDANKLSTLQNDYNGAGTSTIEVSDSVRLNDGKKSINQGEDKKNSWNPSCNDSACSLDNTKASVWGGSRPSNDRHCHDSIDVEKSSQNNLVKTYCEMAISGQDNKVVGKDKYLPSHILNGRECAEKGTGNLLASKKIFYRKENQIEAQGSPGGFIFPPPSLLGFSQSCPALSTNPSNGFNVILDESVKFKLSALVNQMQNQYEEALKILETWARQNSITADQALQLSKLQACLSLISENGQQNTPTNTSEVHSKSNEVLEKLKMEYLESSATILKQQEPVGYTEVNPETVMVEKVNGSYSKGEQCKKEEEIIQSVGVDARCEAGESKQDEKSTWLFRNALVKLVKEILYPIWMEGQFKKKEDHNTIVKKVVDKVISTEGVNIPRTPEHTEKYLSLSKPRISALINDYVVYIKKLADSS